MSRHLVDDSGAEPVVNALGMPVATLIHRAHECGIDTVTRDAADAGLDRDALEAIFTYCAEQHCQAAGAACRGCRVFAEARGIETVDQFVAAHETVRIETGELVLPGRGSGHASFASLDQMATRWAGEAYWFWARRVLRKLRYGVRKADALGGVIKAANTSPPTVILMAPQISDNIGMAARAMGNFGLDEMRVIHPRDGWPSEKARATASGAAAIIDAAGLHDSLDSAISDLNFVAATTARQRDMRKPVLTPAELAAEICRRTAAGQKCGILFGRERNGLASDEVAVCDAIVMIPVRPQFASLNLAQAVLLIGHEWLKTTDLATLGRVTTYEKELEPGINLGRDQPATKQELLGLFEHLESELERLGFFNPSNSPDIVVRNLRTMLGRMGATAQEVRTFRGIVATLAHGKGKRRKVSD